MACVEEYQEHMIQQGVRYKFVYERIDTSGNPFGVAERTAFAEAVGGMDSITVTSVERGLFSSEMEVRAIAEISGPAGQLLSDVPIQSEGELFGGVTYQLNCVEFLERAEPFEVEEAREREEQVIENASATSSGGALASVFGKLEGAIGLITLAVALWAIGQAAGAAENVSG